MAEIRDRYDALVIGGGIAGMQAALDLGEQGFEVLLVETHAVDRRHHGRPQQGLPHARLLELHLHAAHGGVGAPPAHPAADLHRGPVRWNRSATGFACELECKPRYLDEDTCIGCDECELACPVEVPHEFDYGLGARRAIYIPHGNAIPQKAVLDVEHCIFCGKCEKVCPTNCIDFTAGGRSTCDVDVGAVIVATGLDITADGRRSRSTAAAAAERDEPARHGAHPVEQRTLRPRAAASRRQDPALDRLRPVRRQPRPLDRRAVLLARLLHVRPQAGAAAAPLHPRRRGHALLHGHPRVRQGLRAVLPARRGRGRQGDQGQGGHASPRRTTTT